MRPPEGGKESPRCRPGLWPGTRAARVLPASLALLAAAGAVLLAARVAWRPALVPVTLEAVAHEALPRLREAVRARPNDPEARLELMAACRLVGDRLGAWQQLCLAEPLDGPTQLIRRARARVAESLGRLEDAAAAMERACRDAPADLDAALEAFRLRTLLGDFERALALARAALARHPRDPRALQMGGEAAFNAALYAEAIALLRSAREHLPPDRILPEDETSSRFLTAPSRAAVGVQLGVALLRADRGAESATVLEEVTRAPDAPAQAWEYLGQARLSLGQTEAAGDAFRRAEAAKAPGGGVAFGQALVALAGGDRKTAEAALRRALERDPEHAAAAVTLAQLLASRGRSADAAAVRARSALALGDTAEAVAFFRQAVALADRETGPSKHPAPGLLVPLLRDLARALQEQGDGPGALAALRRARSLAPNDAEIVRQHAETALALFASQEALQVAARYAALCPKEQQQVEWWRFRAYRQLQDAPRAAAALAAASRLEPMRPEFLTWQARTVLESAPDAAQVAAAGALLRRALLGSVDDVEVHSSLAEVYTRQERWAEAGEHLRRALTLDPEWGRGRHWLQLAQADRGLGLISEARWDQERYREAEALRAALARRRFHSSRQSPATAGDGARLVAWSRAALRAGRLREARAVARAAVRAAPDDPAAYRALAAACQRLGRLEDRIVAMEAAVKADGASKPESGK